MRTVKRSLAYLLFAICGAICAVTAFCEIDGFAIIGSSWMQDIPTHLSTSDSYEKHLLVQQGFLLKCIEFLLGRGLPIIGVGAGLGLLFGIGLDALRKRLAERLSKELDPANATKPGVG